MGFSFKGYPIDDNTSIDVLRLSNRATNLLKRKNVFLVVDLLGMDAHDLGALRGMGKHTLTEIASTIDQIEEDSTVTLGSEGMGKAITKLKMEPKNESKNNTDDSLFLLIPALNHLKIQDSDLSARAKHCLERAGIVTASDLFKLSESTLMSLPHCGRKTANEVIAYKEELQKDLVGSTSSGETDIIQNEQEVSNAFWLHPILRVFAQANNSVYRREMRSIEKAVSENINKANSDSVSVRTISDAITSFVTGPFFNKIFTDAAIMRANREGNITEENLRAVFPNELVVLYDRYVDVWRESHFIEEKGEYFILEIPTVMDYVSSLADDKKKFFLLRKLSGVTLEEIGTEYNLTRERVRQIINKALRRVPLLYEDRFKWLFENFKLRNKEFAQILNLDTSSVEYIALTTKRGEAKIEDAVIDSLPERFRTPVENYLYKDYIVENGVYIKKSKIDIARYLLKQYEEPVLAEDLLDAYNDLLRRHNLEEDESLITSRRYFETTLPRLDEVLLVHGRRLKYTGLSHADIPQLLEKLEFNSFHNVEISTKLFVTRYPEVLEEYDIHNEYELHNLLKKHLQDKNVHFNRQPMLSIGKANREAQVFDLMIENAPISQYDLAVLYEDQYGVDSATVLANYFRSIDEYLDKGVFSIEYEDLTQEEKDALQSILNEDVMPIEGIRKLYEARLPRHDLHKLSTYNFKLLGYKVNHDIVYRADRYQNLDQIVSGLFVRDVCDLSDRKWLFHSPTINSKLNMMRSSGQIYEYAPLTYVSSGWISQVGLSEADLKEYSNAVQVFAKGHVFTTRSLKARGFINPFKDYQLPDLFWESVIISSGWAGHQRLAGTMIFQESRETTFHSARIIRDIVEQYGSISVKDITDLLNYDYGISVDKTKVVTLAQEADLFYSSAKKKIYVSYEQYFAEL